MQYEYRISQRARELLAFLPSTSVDEIKKQRSQSSGSVGHSLFWINQKKKLTEAQVSRMLRKELYGPAGFLITCFEGFYIKENGEEIRWTMNGKEVRGRSKVKSKLDGLYIPERVAEYTSIAIDSLDGLFEGEIEESSLPVLEFMMKRTLELRQKYGTRWYPYFSDLSISKAMGKPEEEINQVTTDLTGVICEGYKMRICRPWQKRLIIPSSRFSLVGQLLGWNSRTLTGPSLSFLSKDKNSDYWRFFGKLPKDENPDFQEEIAA